MSVVGNNGYLWKNLPPPLPSHPLTCPSLWCPWLVSRLTSFVRYVSVGSRPSSEIFSWSPVFLPPLNPEFSQAFYFFPLFRSVFNQALQDGHGKLTKDNLIVRYEVIEITLAEKLLLTKDPRTKALTDIAIFNWVASHYLM